RGGQRGPGLLAELGPGEAEAGVGVVHGTVGMEPEPAGELGVPSHRGGLHAERLGRPHGRATRPCAGTRVPGPRGVPPHTTAGGRIGCARPPSRSAVPVGTRSGPGQNGHELSYFSTSENHPVEGPGQRNCVYRVSSSTNRLSQEIEYFAIVVLELLGAKWLAPSSSR